MKLRLHNCITINDIPVNADVLNTYFACLLCRSLNPISQSDNEMSSGSTKTSEYIGTASTGRGNTILRPANYSAQIQFAVGVTGCILRTDDFSVFVTH